MTRETGFRLMGSRNFQVTFPNGWMVSVLAGSWAAGTHNFAYVAQLSDKEQMMSEDELHALFMQEMLVGAREHTGSATTEVADVEVAVMGPEGCDDDDRHIRVTPLEFLKILVEVAER